jgi:hypothetical protein
MVHLFEGVLRKYRDIVMVSLSYRKNEISLGYTKLLKKENTRPLVVYLTCVPSAAVYL